MSPPPAFLRAVPPQPVLPHVPPQTAGRPPHAAPAPRPSRRPALAFVAAAASPCALVVGLTLPDGEAMMWLDHPTWAVFALLCALAGLVAGYDGDHRTLWPVQVGALAGLVLSWAVVVAPVAATDRGFVLTLPVLLALLAVWAGEHRPRTGRFAARGADWRA